jgi:hypothetical protein
VEAASFHGRAVYFLISWPWTKPSRTPEARGVSSLFQLAILVLCLAAAAIVARYNWKAGRSDPRSAIRIGLYCAGASLLTWLIGAHHVASSGELDLAADALSSAARLFVIFWLVYLALEPWIRRYWPQTLITWSRLLAGRWRDPMVGRDILYGAVCGMVYCLLFMTYYGISLRMGEPDFSDFAVDNLMGARAAAYSVANHLFGSLSGAVQIFLLFFLLRVLLRKQWLAALVFVAIFTFNHAAQEQFNSVPAAVAHVVFYTLTYGILVLVMLRLGFFAMMTTLFVVDGTLSIFLTSDFGAWYGQSSLIIVLVVSAFAFWGFRQSLGGRPVFSATALDR